MRILKVMKTQGFTVSPENTFLEMPQEGQIDPQAFLGLE